MPPIESITPWPPLNMPKATDNLKHPTRLYYIKKKLESKKEIWEKELNIILWAYAYHQDQVHESPLSAYVMMLKPTSDKALISNNTFWCSSIPKKWTNVEIRSRVAWRQSRNIIHAFKILSTYVMRYYDHPVPS